MKKKYLVVRIEKLISMSNKEVHDVMRNYEDIIPYPSDPMKNNVVSRYFACPYDDLRRNVYRSRIQRHQR